MEGDTVALSCRVRPYSNFKLDITVELTDNRGRRLTFVEHSLQIQFISVQHNVRVSSSMSGPFHCTVTAAAVATETVSKTFSVALNSILGEFFYHAPQFCLRDIQCTMLPFVDYRLMLYRPLASKMKYTMSTKSKPNIFFAVTLKMIHKFPSNLACRYSSQC